jgi:PAS domain S-box-containing protein
MHERVSASGKEMLMRDDDFIVSRTDTRGRITYGNKIFIEFSGYAEKELLGAPHNIIRHADMPRGVFKYLWQTLSGGDECFAYVKNLARNGSFYWVFANVTPDVDERGQVGGYFSVRRKPRAGAVSAVADVYRAMSLEERLAGQRDGPAASLAWLGNVLSQKGLSYEEFILSL